MSTSNFVPGGPVLGLPTLSGSARQVAWAEEIRAKAIRTAMATLSAVPADAIAVTCDRIEELVNTPDAASWIFIRNANFNAAHIAVGAQ